MSQLLDQLAEHEPHEGQGGGIECCCSWPSREDFKSRGKDWWPDYNEHVLEVLGLMEVGAR